MLAAPLQIVRLQVQCLERSQIFGSKMGELVQELLQALASTFVHLRKAVKGIEWPRLAVLKNDARPQHPVGALPDNQVAQDVERAPGVFPCDASFVTLHPDVRQ